MAKLKSVYVCQNCGNETSKWFGQCPACKEWNTITEEPVAVAQPASGKASARSALKAAKAYTLNEITGIAEVRYRTGLNELDRVLGSGIVKGSVILISGDPGIGKSTILLQICSHLSRQLNILYVSGEESERQIKLRAVRLGVVGDNLRIMCETDVEAICEYVRTNTPDMLIVDSIQTMNLSELSSSSGSITQVRECTNMILRTCKALEIPAFIVGHVNKDGNVAGPKVLEHIVDAVLYFEGERTLTYRILRAIKNRYGATNEIGVFEMRDNGLEEVENPSMMLLAGRPVNVSGSCVASIMEGSRPVLAEVQGLVSQSSYGNARRMVTGFDYNRMCLILAVLEKRAGYNFAGMDTYVNIIGGLKLNEPAADLPLALSLVSNFKDKPIDNTTVVFGEIGLAGEIRAVGNSELRIAEAARMGFKRCIMPRHNLKGLSPSIAEKIEIIGVRNIREAIECL